MSCRRSAAATPSNTSSGRTIVSRPSGRSTTDDVGVPASTRSLGGAAQVRARPWPRVVDGMSSTMPQPCRSSTDSASRTVASSARSPATSSGLTRTGRSPPDATAASRSRSRIRSSRSCSTAATSARSQSRWATEPIGRSYLHVARQVRYCTTASVSSNPEPKSSQSTSRPRSSCSGRSRWRIDASGMSGAGYRCTTATSSRGGSWIHASTGGRVPAFIVARCASPASCGDGRPALGPPRPRPRPSRRGQLARRAAVMSSPSSAASRSGTSVPTRGGR